MMQLIASTNKLDILGPKFSFYIGNNRLKTLKSVFGGILSLFFILFMITATYVFGKKWIEKSHPTVSVNSYFSKRDHYLNLYSKNVFVCFAMFDGVKFPKTENTKKFFTISAQFETTYMQEAIDPERRTVAQPIPVVRCEDLNNNHTDFASKAFSMDGGEFYRGSVFCLDRHGDTNWRIRGAPFELPYSIIRFKVYPCSLKNPQECASPRELANGLLIIPIYSKSVDFQNFTDPLRVGIDTDLTSKFSLATKTQLTMWYRESSIYDDNADFIKSLDARMTYIEQDKVTTTIGTRDGSFHCTEIQIEDGECKPYIEIVVRASPSSTLVERRYYKLLNAVSEVGGFGELVFILLALISTCFNNCYQTRWVRRQLYQDLVNLNHEEYNNLFLNQKASKSNDRAQNRDNKNILNGDEPQETHVRELLQPSTRSKKRGLIKSNRRQRMKDELEGYDQDLNKQLEEFRVNFDYLELIDVSKKCLICASIFLKDFHKELLPSLLYSVKRNNLKRVKIDEPESLGHPNQEENEGMEQFEDSDEGSNYNNHRDEAGSNEGSRAKEKRLTRPKDEWRFEENEIVEKSGREKRRQSDISVLVSQALICKLENAKNTRNGINRRTSLQEIVDNGSRRSSINNLLNHKKEKKEENQQKEQKKFRRAEMGDIFCLGDLGQIPNKNQTDNFVKNPQNQSEVSFFQLTENSHKERRVSIGDELLKKRQLDNFRERRSVAAKFKSSKKQQKNNFQKKKKFKFRSEQGFRKFEKQPKEKQRGEKRVSFTIGPQKMRVGNIKLGGYSDLRRNEGSNKNLLSEIPECD